MKYKNANKWDHRIWGLLTNFDIQLNSIGFILNHQSFDSIKSDLLNSFILIFDIKNKSNKLAFYDLIVSIYE